MELLLGAGSNHKKRIRLPEDTEEWSQLITVDINPDHHPHVVADAGSSLPFASDTFDQIHCYHTLEHLGQQGDWQAFFRQFDEYARILKINGYFFGICPSIKSMWAWGDPGHTRVITSGTLTFLDRTCYNQVGTTTMSDYRPYFTSDWKIVQYTDDDNEFTFLLQLRGR